MHVPEWPRKKIAGRGFRLFGAQFDRLAQDWAQHRADVGGVRHQRRALLDELVRPFRAWVERRARHREHLAPLFEREAGGDQRA